MNNFVLNYGYFSFGHDENKLLNFIRYNRLVSQYFQPFVGTFFLKSEAMPQALTESFRGHFGKDCFFLVDFPSWRASGALPPEIWQWLNHGQVPPPPSAPPPPPAFTNILQSFNAPKNED